MAILKKFIYHYFVGVLISASLIILIILLDFFKNNYLQYPELKNFILVSLYGGIGFGLAHFALIEIKKSNKQKTN
jgi:hypothetical protein